MQTFLTKELSAFKGALNRGEAHSSSCHFPEMTEEPGFQKSEDENGYKKDYFDLYLRSCSKECPEIEATISG